MTALRQDAPIGYVPVRLTERERRVLELMAAGHDRDAMATELAYSLQTIKNTIAALFDKFGATTWAQAVHEAHRHGWLSFDDAMGGLHQRLNAAEKRTEALESEVRALRSRITRAAGELRGDAR